MFAHKWIIILLIDGVKTILAHGIQSEVWHRFGFLSTVSGSSAFYESMLNIIHVFNGLVHGVELLEHLDTNFGGGSGGADEGKGEFHDRKLINYKKRVFYFLN